MKKQLLRYAAIFLALSLMVSLCVFSVSAEENATGEIPPIEFIAYSWNESTGEYNSNPYYLPLINGILQNLNSKRVKITGIRILNTDIDNSKFYLRFRFGFVTTEDTIVHRVAKYPYVFSFNVSSTAGSNFRGNMNTSGCQAFYQEWATQYICSSLTSITWSCILDLKKSSSYQYMYLPNPFTMYMSDTNNARVVQPYIDKIYSFYSLEEFLSDYFDQFGEQFSDIVSNLVNFVTSWIHYAVPFFMGMSSTLTYDEIVYNETTGNLIVETHTGYWYDAILAQLNSITADARVQIRQQEKATNQGAEDALDAAYNKSSFLDLIPILNFSDFGSYDDDIVEDLAGDGPLDWFSNATKNDLDSRPSGMKGSSDIVHFYDSNVLEIEDILSGSRAERRRAAQ